MALIPFEAARLSMSDESGTVVLRDGLVVTFFVPESHRVVAPVVRALIDRYRSMPGVPAHWWGLDDEGIPCPFDPSHVSEFLDRKLLGTAEECDLWLADKGSGAADFQVRYHGLDLPRRRGEGWPRATSGVSFTFPSDYGEESGILGIFGFANELTHELPFTFGLVSPAFLLAEGAQESVAFACARALSRRYVCLEIPSLLIDCFECGAAAKNIYWGSYFGGALLAGLGGERGARSAFSGFGAKFELLRPEKVSVYLGPLPTAGDVNRREDTSRYRRAFDVIRAFLPDRVLTCSGFKDDEFDAWLHRHDDQRQ